MSKNKVSVEGADSLIEKLANTAHLDRCVKAVKQGCALVERAAKEKVDKGNLRNSIKYEVTVENGAIKGVVYTPVEYAPYVEFGTGMYAEGGNGRKETPWVYVEGSSSGSSSKTVYITKEDAIGAMMFLREKGLDAHITYGQKPKPFLRPAFNENKRNIKEKLKEAAMPMIDLHQNIVEALKNIGLPVHYEMFLHSGLKAPCISYLEISNIDEMNGDTHGYSRISYQVKIWANDIGTIQAYTVQIDGAMRSLGFRRSGSAELHDTNSAMIQKVLTYEVIAYEEY